MGARSQNNILLLGSICGLYLLQQLSFFPPLIFFKCNHICEVSLLSNRVQVDGLTALEPAALLVRQGCSRQSKQCAISLLISSAQPSPRAERADRSPSAAAPQCLRCLLCHGIVLWIFWVTLKIPMQQKSEQHSASTQSTAAHRSWLAKSQIPPVCKCLFLAVSLAGSRQPPPLPSDAFQTYLGKHGLVSRNTGARRRAVTELCSAAREFSP